MSAWAGDGYEGFYLGAGVHLRKDYTMSGAIPAKGLHNEATLPHLLCPMQKETP